MKKIGEPRRAWAFERDESGLVVRMRAVEITEESAAAWKELDQALDESAPLRAAGEGE